MTKQQFQEMDAQEILKTIFAEYQNAKEHYPKDFSSHHEAYGVILEELDELWTNIKKKEKDYDKTAMRKEAVQLGAMVLRYIVELVPMDWRPL